MKLTVAIIQRDVLLREVLRKKLELYARENNVEICISTFENPCEFEDFELTFHLLVTDTEFGEPIADGIAWVKKMRKMRRYLYVIYVSASEERVFEAIETCPLAFVRQRQLDEDLRNAWNIYISKEEREPSLVIIPEGRKRHIYILDNIVALHSNGHYIDVLLRDEEKRVHRGKMDDMEKLLEEYGFLRVHTSHLINIRYIASIDRKKVCLYDKTIYNLSPKYREDVYKKLAIYKYEGNVVNENK